MQTERKKTLLYFMGIDWNWIYQRPQIIAEYLSNDYEVTVAYPVKIWGRHTSKDKKKENSTVHHRIIWTFPFQRKSKIIAKAAALYQKWLFRDSCKYDYIYIGYPVFIECIPKDYKGCIIYDCMDDHVQMCSKDVMRRKVEETEKVLLQRSKILIASSQKLQEKMAKQVTPKKINLIRNGTNFGKIYDVKETNVKKQFHIGYIGTIAEWFDKDMLEKSVEMHSELVYHLLGPCLTPQQIKHDRIIYEGVVEHTNLHSFVKDYDCLIMPFLINEVVQAVDPVKLYEYIAFGKCIISVYYEELERFTDYVYFYTTKDSFECLIADLISRGFPPKYNDAQQEIFLAENSWDERYKLIREALNQ